MQAAPASPAAEAPHPGLPLPQRWHATVAIVLGIAMTVIEGMIVNLALPALARVVHNQGVGEVRNVLDGLRRNLLRVNSGLSLLAVAAWGVLVWQGQRADLALAGASAIFLLQLASFYVGQLVLPEANYLQTVEETRLPLRVNVVSLILFVLACGGVMAIVPPGADAVIGLFSVLLGATLTRNLLLRRAVLRRAPEVFA